MDYIECKDSDKYSAGLQIQLIRQSYVFPWCQFLFAEGDSSRIHLAFSTHDITITGVKLDKLLEKITAQIVCLIREPIRAESMMPNAGAEITGIVVKKIEKVN